MTGHHPGERLADALAAAERDSFTGVIYGPAAYNLGDEQGVQPVFIYHHGICTDRYVTAVGRTGPGSGEGIRAEAGQVTAARRLGQEHGQAGTTPFGEPGHAYPKPGSAGAPSYAEYVSWDAGSGRLLGALGETGDTTPDNHAARAALVDAYCDAYERARAIALHGPGFTAELIERADWYWYTGSPADEQPYLTAGTTGPGAYDLRCPMEGGPVQWRPVGDSGEWRATGFTVPGFSRDYERPDETDSDGYDFRTYVPRAVLADR